MLSLLSLTFFTSFTDSFNPFGIVQQFTLQGLLKKTQHIWYYIWSMFVTNYAAGVLFYIGTTTLRDQFLSKHWSAIQTPLALGALILGGALVWYSVHLFLLRWTSRDKLSAVAEKEATELAAKLSGKELTPSALIGIGFATTLLELTTAAPYLAYLTIVQQYRPTAGHFLVLLFLYNVVYCAPLFILYYLSIFFQGTFEKIYRRINKVLQFVSAFLVPAILLILALLLIVFGMNTIL